MINIQDWEDQGNVADLQNSVWDYSCEMNTKLFVPTLWSETMHHFAQTIVVYIREDKQVYSVKINDHDYTTKPSI